MDQGSVASLWKHGLFVWHSTHTHLGILGQFFTLLFLMCSCYDDLESLKPNKKEWKQKSNSGTIFGKQEKEPVLKESR